MTEVPRVSGERRRDEEASPIAAEFGLSREELRPLLEGARARGLADAFEMLATGAIMLDETGAVLHCSSHALRTLGGDLRLVGRQLVAADGASNQVLEQLIALVLAGEVGEAVIGGRAGLRLQIRPMPGASEDAAQLLKAVLFVSAAELQDEVAACDLGLEQACAA